MKRIYVLNNCNSWLISNAVTEDGVHFNASLCVFEINLTSESPACGDSYAVVSFISVKREFSWNLLAY